MSIERLKDEKPIKKKSVLFLYTINEVLATEKCKKVPFIIGTKPHEKKFNKI